MIAVSIIISELYTLYYFMDNVFKQLQTVCLCPYTIVCLQKMKLDIYRYEDVYKQYVWLEALFLANQTGRRQKLLKKNIDKIIFLMKCTILTVIFASFIYGAYPIYGFVFKGKRELLANFLLPGTDDESLTGFYVNSCYIFIISCLCIVGITAFDMFMQFMICGYTSFSVLLEDSVKSLNSMLFKNKHSAKYRRMYLRNIWVGFQDAERYIAQINDLFESIFVNQVLGMSSSMILTLFCIVADNWTGGIGFFGFILTFFLSMCYMGTIVQTSKLREIVYEINWYLMPVEDQKMVLLLLMKSQNCTEMWIGCFAPLNVESGAKVLKFIYNTFMYMSEFLSE